MQPGALHFPRYAILVCHSFPSKEQDCFNFMVAVTILSDFGAQEEKKKKSVTASTFSPSVSNEVLGPDAFISVF